MALSQHDLQQLLESLRAAENVDMVRLVLERMLQELIEAETTTVIGAHPHQRTPDRTTRRNGHRDRKLTTTAGDVDLRIPKLFRAGCDGGWCVPLLVESGCWILRHLTGPTDLILGLRGGAIARWLLRCWGTGWSPVVPGGPVWCRCCGSAGELSGHSGVYRRGGSGLLIRGFRVRAPGGLPTKPQFRAPFQGRRPGFFSSQTPPACSKLALLS